MMTQQSIRNSVISAALSSTILVSSQLAEAADDDRNSSVATDSLTVLSETAYEYGDTKLGGRLGVTSKAASGIAFGTAIGRADIPEFISTGASMVTERYSVLGAAKACNRGSSIKTRILFSAACAGAALYLNHKGVKEPIEAQTRDILSNKFLRTEPEALQPVERLRQPRELADGPSDFFHSRATIFRMNLPLLLATIMNMRAIKVMLLFRMTFLRVKNNKIRMPNAAL